MKKLSILTIFLFSFLFSIAQKQDKCGGDYSAVSVGYAFPNSAVLGADYFTNLGLVAGTSIAYTFPEAFDLKEGENSYEPNTVDFYLYAGWRLIRKDYRVSVFGNVGATYGNVAGLQPFTSVKLLFPIDNKAVSFEPIYIVGRGATIRLSLHFKL